MSFRRKTTGYSAVTMLGRLEELIEEAMLMGLDRRLKRKAAIRLRNNLTKAYDDLNDDLNEYRRIMRKVEGS